MKKLSLLLVIALLITIFPFNVFAKESTPLVSKTYRPFMVDNNLDYIKQKLSERIDELYDESQNIKYTNEIKKLIDDSYNQLMETINNAVVYEDIIDTELLPYGIIEYNETIYQKQLYLASLMDFNYEVVKEKTNFEDIKERAILNIDLAFENLSFNGYNDYYKSKIDRLKEEIYDNYNNVSDYSNLANANAKALVIFTENISDVDLNFSYDSAIYEYDKTKAHTNRISPKNTKNKYTLQEESETYDEIIERLNGREYKYRDIDLYKKIYTNNEVYDIKDSFTSLLQDYYYYSVYVPTGEENEEAVDILYDACAEIYESDSVSELENIYENAKDNLIKVTGIKFKKLSNASKQRLQNEVYKTSLNYLDSSKYSGYNYYRIKYILEVAQEYYENAIYEFEVSEFFVINLEGILKDIPTLKQELKTAKNKYIGYLKAFLNNKKYNQKKVKPIVNEGINKINKATSIKEVKNIYNSYYNKAKKMINTYKITTTKEGKGYITKGKTVNYGTNLTIKITPNKGYKIKSLYVDGKKVKTTTKYTFKNIKANHKIKAIFIKK